MKKRSDKLELIDLGSDHYSEEEYADCLKKIGFINKLFGGDRASMRAFGALPAAPDSILDVGCGGGLFAIQLAQRYPDTQVVGIDIDPDAISIAWQNKNEYEEKHKTKLNNLDFETSKKLEKQYDVITATLVCHHMLDDVLVQFLIDAKKVARKAIIINDLQRSWLAYILFWLISPFFNNRLIRHDGLLSIRRGFTHAELVSYLAKAGIKPENYTIARSWAFRWIITVITHD